MKTIYWFKDKGLFIGHPQQVGLTSIEQLEHECDAMIVDSEITKNRYGRLRTISQNEFDYLYSRSLSDQLQFFKDT